MMLDALGTRSAVAIAAVALLATLAGSLFWFSRMRREAAIRIVPCRVAIVAPQAEPLVIVLPESVDPQMPILRPAGPVDSAMVVAAPATGDLGIVAQRAVIAAAA